MTNPMDYPALDGRVITEGHAQICRDKGHATYTKDGVLQNLCPRCGHQEFDTIIALDKEYDGHWKGEAWITYHTYGEQVHRTHQDAIRWNDYQRKLSRKGW